MYIYSKLFHFVRLAYLATFLLLLSHLSPKAEGSRPDRVENCIFVEFDRVA